MSRVALPDVSTKFIADVEGMLRDLKRAENATRSSATNIDREVDQLTRKLRSKFSLSDIGKDVLKGIGVGSGFALAQQGAELVSSYWKKAAEEAQSVEQSAAAQLDLVEKIIARRQTEEQRVDALRRKERDAMKDFEKVQRDAVVNYSTIMSGIAGGSTVGSLLDLVLGTPNEDEVAAAAVVWQKAFDLQDEIARRVEKQKQDVKVANALTDFFAPLDQQSTDNAERMKAEERRIRDVMEWRSRLQREANDELEREAQALVQRIATPQEQHAARLARINTLLATQKISQEQATRAMVDSFKTLDSEEMDRVNRKLADFFEPLDKQSERNFKAIEERANYFRDAMNNMWANVSDRAGQAFADMVLMGKASFSDLADLVARSIIEVIARMAIINPILNALFGGFGLALPAFFGSGAPARATGGEVNAGEVYRVNEVEQEYFVPKTAGRVVPGSRMGSGGTQNVFAPVYNIAAGVTRQELLPILRMHGRAMMASISDAQRRNAPLASPL